MPRRIELQSRAIGSGRRARWPEVSWEWSVEELDEIGVTVEEALDLLAEVSIRARRSMDGKLHTWVSPADAELAMRGQL